MKSWACIVALLVSCGCPRLSSPYSAFLSSPTDYEMPPCGEWKTTPSGTPIWAPAAFDTIEFRKQVDAAVGKLELCLGIKIRRSGFAVFIPSDWYVSKCSGEQLVPSLADCKLCRAKGLVISEECCGLRRPTIKCPCVCNFRATVQRSRVIVTAPNMKLFKTELARLVLYPKHNNPWADPAIATCVNR